MSNWPKFFYSLQEALKYNKYNFVWISFAIDQEFIGVEITPLFYLNVTSFTFLVSFFSIFILSVTLAEREGRLVPVWAIPVQSRAELDSLAPIKTNARSIMIWLTYYNASRVVARHSFLSIVSSKNASGFAFYFITNDSEPVDNVSNYFIKILNDAILKKYKFDRIDIYDLSTGGGVNVFKK